MGILDNKTMKIPTPITIQPIKNKGASVFILKYIIQDEVVNGNVPLPRPQKYYYTKETQGSQSPTTHPLLFCIGKRTKKLISP